MAVSVCLALLSVVVSSEISYGEVVTGDPKFRSVRLELHAGCWHTALVVAVIAIGCETAALLAPARSDGHRKRRSAGIHGESSGKTGNAAGGVAHDYLKSFSVSFATVDGVV